MIEREPAGDATVDLGPLWRAFRAGRIWIAAGAIAGIAGGLVGWSLTGVKYDAIATVAVNQPRTATPGLASTPTASYVALIRNHTVVARALEAAGLSSPSAPLHPAIFMRQSLSVDEVPGTNLIRIRVRQPDPNIATRVAQQVAEGAVALSRDVSQQEGTVLRGRLQSQMTEAAKRLQTTEEDFLRFRESGQLEVLQNEVEALLEEAAKLPEAETDLAGAEARAAAAKQELTSRSPTLRLEETIDRVPALTEAARSQTGGDLKALLGIGVTRQEANPAFQAVDEEAADAAMDLAQRRHERNQVLAAVKRLQQSKTLPSLYAKEIEFARREADVALARRVYDDVASRYEQARVIVTSGTAQLQVVDEAIAMPEPATWPAGVWMAMGALIGVGIALALLAVRVVFAYSLRA